MTHTQNLSLDVPELRLSVFGSTDIGLVRKKNEDAFAICPFDGRATLHSLSEPLQVEVQERGVLLAVSDGLGGEKAGEVASALALHCLRSSLSHAHSASVEQALTRSVEAANREILAAGQAEERRGMGATLTAALIHGAHAYVAEVGDSRAYLLRGGRFLQLTRDQSYAELMVEAGMLRRDQINNFVYRNLVLQALGTRPEVQVGLTRVRLCEGDRLLLCSDGLSGQLSDEEMAHIIQRSGDVRWVCQALIDAAKSTGGPDNITVVVAIVESGAGAPCTTDRISLETIHSPSLDSLSRRMG
ncbi:MAG TPA: protein phosphatase 2C domain-containing protein [Polyangiaceae bacterium]|nr:protein phosphatase 2C domain-containing protein [Polyangiaceae bacterium]